MEVFGVYVPTWLLLILTLVLLVYVWFTWRHGELKALGLPHPPPTWFLGNVGMFLGKPGFQLTDTHLCQKYGKIFGLYEGRNPTIVVADVDIIKNIMVKDFNSFINRRTTALQGITKYALLNAHDDHWRHLRRLSSPAFTSGKLKYMYRQIGLNMNKLILGLEKNANEGEAFDVKKIVSAFTLEVIGATAFGLQLDSQEDPNHPFIVKGNELFDVARKPLFAAVMFMPYLLAPLELFEDFFTNKGPIKFFTDVLRQTIKERRESTQLSNHVDFLQLMIDSESLLEGMDEEVKQELEDGGLITDTSHREKGLTEVEVIAQAFIFMLAGYETSATALAFVLYLLAANPDIQDRVLEEIQEVWMDKEELNYGDINKLKYMDMCIEETLRLYPPAPRLDRVACEDKTYKDLRIPKGYLVVIPIRALHYDPDIWPEPEKFDPERFSPEAKAARNPYYYMPFGMGPRNCVGMRFAQMELKLALATILKKFRLTVSSKCKEPLELENSIFLRVVGGLWLEAQPRE